MKKILFILAIALLSFNQSAKAQCAYTHIELGNTTTLTYLWPIAFIYALDSVRIDFGDGKASYKPFLCRAPRNIPMLTLAYTMFV